MEQVGAQDLASVAAQLLAPPVEVDLSHVAPIRVSLSCVTTTSSSALISPNARATGQ